MPLKWPRKNLKKQTLKSTKNIKLSSFFSELQGLNYPSYQLFEATFQYSVFPWSLKGHFLPFLAPCTHFRQDNLFFLIKVDQKYLMKQFDIFHKACTRIFNNINFRLQGLQIGAFQQRYFKCKCETPYFKGELVPKTCKK